MEPSWNQVVVEEITDHFFHTEHFQPAKNRDQRSCHEEKQEKTAEKAFQLSAMQNSNLFSFHLGSLGVHVTNTVALAMTNVIDKLSGKGQKHHP